MKPYQTQRQASDTEYLKWLKDAYLAAQENADKLKRIYGAAARLHRAGSVPEVVENKREYVPF